MSAPSITDLIPSELAAPAVPCLAPGHRIPSHGASRVDALAAGLAPGWRLVASTDSTERKRHGGRGFQGRWSFMAHLLTTAPHDDTAAQPAAGDPTFAVRWAVALTWDNNWLTGDRHEVIEQALAHAVVEDTLAALVRQFASSDTLPNSHPSGDGQRVATEWPPTARWSVLAMLFEQPFPGRAAEQMLVDLTFGVGAVGAHQHRVAVEGARETAVNEVRRRFERLVEQARTVGLAREGWVTYRAGTALREAATEHWDEATGSFRAGFAEAEHAGWQAFFGDVLADLRLPAPLGPPQP